MTTGAWVLIIAMYSPGGEFIGKEVVPKDTKVTCEQEKDRINSTDDFAHVKRRAICVSRAHWEGKKKYKGVAFD